MATAVGGKRKKGMGVSKLWITSDLHLGHKNICKYRKLFTDAEEHHNTMFENLATTVGKRDTLYLLGDIAFDKYWLNKIANINCNHKLLVCGNHDTERGINMRMLVEAYDNVMSLFSKRNIWFSHCPIHPQEIRGRLYNIHGHLHGNVVEGDSRYFNACVEHTNWKPILFSEIDELMRRRLL